MSKTLLTLVLSIAFFSAFSQQDSLLKNFKYRIDHYQAIGLNVSGVSDYRKFNYPSGTQKNSASSGGIGASYYAFKSTDKIQLTTSGALYSSFISGKSTSVNDVSKDRNFSISPSFSILNKWFSGNNFVEFGAGGNENYNKRKNTGINNPGNYTQNQYSIEINTGIGKGRLENITDMQNALWLNQALTASKSLSRPLSAEELTGLGQAITKGNNTRVLDTRKRTQFTLTTVDDYLQQQGLINKTDINYFSSLNDILFYAFNAPRLSGMEKYIRFTPSMTGSDNDQTQYNPTNRFKNRFTNKSLELTSGISKYSAKNLVHQNNYGSFLKFNYVSSDASIYAADGNGLISETKDNGVSKLASINLFYEHAIYPNTRTTINFNFQSEYGYFEAESSHGFFGRSSLYGALNYFISYRTRLTCNIGAEYQKNAWQTYQGYSGVPENLSLYANVGVNISL
ncbi:hypothetical protein BH11BAC5_BH11BAC5_05510 [soil metagenome]